MTKSSIRTIRSVRNDWNEQMKRSDGSELNIFWRLCNEDFAMDAVTFRELAQTVWASFCELNFQSEDIDKYKMHDLSRLHELFADADFIKKYEKDNPVFTASGAYIGYGQHPRYKEARKVRHFEAFLLYMDKLVVERLGPFNRQDVFQARKASYREYRRSYSQSGTLPPLPKVSTRKRLSVLAKKVSNVFTAKPKGKGSDHRSGHDGGPKLKK